MPDKRKVFRGAFLGLAVGDAMGSTIDSKTLDAICADYGPNGLMGYDLVNGYAEVSSYTQLAAYTANGIIMTLARNQAYGRSAPVIHYISLALREWARNQQYNSPERDWCWLSKEPEMTHRNCMDIGLLSALTREKLGSMKEPVSYSNSPTALTEAVPIALQTTLIDLEQEPNNAIAAEVVALTHGDGETFLSAAALTHALGVLLEAPDIGVKALVESVVDTISSQFGAEYGDMEHLWELLQQAQTLAQDRSISPMEAMEQLRCTTAAEVLAGALYACITCDGDFDTAIITAVNHSGRSAAVGAITGAAMGICFGEDVIPEFYLESLEPVQLLRQLADDMVKAGIKESVNRLFDVDWNEKYFQAGI